MDFDNIEGLFKLAIFIWIAISSVLRLFKKKKPHPEDVESIPAKTSKKRQGKNRARKVDSAIDGHPAKPMVPTTEPALVPLPIAVQTSRTFDEQLIGDAVILQALLNHRCRKL